MTEPKAYYDKVLSKPAALATLNKLEAGTGRKHKGGLVYTMGRGGEAFAEPAGGGIRLRLFAGKCPC